MGLLLGDQRVDIFALGDGQQPQLAQAFDDHRVGVRALKRVGGQRGHQDLRVGPVGALEHAGFLQGARTRLDRRATAFLQHHPSRQVEDPAHLAGLGEIGSRGKRGGCVVELGGQPAQLARFSRLVTHSGITPRGLLGSIRHRSPDPPGVSTAGAFRGRLRRRNTAGPNGFRRPCVS